MDGIPVYTADDFTAARQALLPPGAAWTRDPAAPISRFLAFLAKMDERIWARAVYLLTDAFPASAFELLPEWESSLGLPDPCAGEQPTVELRQAQVVARLIASGGQSIAYFIAVAAALGFAITVTEFAPLRAGFRAGSPCCDDTWAHVWQVNAPAFTVVTFRAGIGTAGEPLRSWGNTVLQCELQRMAPAHTILLFNYS